MPSSSVAGGESKAIVAIFNGKIGGPIVLRHDIWTRPVFTSIKRSEKLAARSGAKSSPFSQLKCGVEDTDAEAGGASKDSSLMVCEQTMTGAMTQKSPLGWRRTMECGAKTSTSDERRFIDLGFPFIFPRRPALKTWYMNMVQVDGTTMLRIWTSQRSIRVKELHSDLALEVFQEVAEQALKLKTRALLVA